jgi:capsular polysaccharide biosynthesis protein
VTGSPSSASGRFAKKFDRLIHDARGAWCARFGPPLEIVSAAPAIRERISIRPPARTAWENPLDEAYYGPGEGRAVVEHPEVFLYRLKDVSITGSEAMMFVGPHTLLRLDPSQSDFALAKVRRPIAWLARRVEGPVLPLGGRGTGNRAHFLCEHLPRVLLAREHLGASFPLKFLVTPDHARWQAEYLERLGESPANVIEGSRGTVFCPEVLFVPNLSLTEQADIYEPGIYREIVRRLKRGLPPRQRRRRIFITRKDAPSRRLLNEDEVFAMLRAAYPDLERVSLAVLSLREQIALFDEARFVVGPIGQAFRNLLFCEGALCIHLVPGHRGPENAYYVWALNENRLGMIHGNRCLSLYAGEPFVKGDWSFPLKTLKMALQRLEALGEAGTG